MKKQTLHSAHGNIHWVAIVGLFIIAVVLGVMLVIQRGEIRGLRQDLSVISHDSARQNDNEISSADSWSVYKNDELRFEIAKPRDATIGTRGIMDDSQLRQYGRVGVITIGNVSENHTSTYLSINAYSDKTSLERDFTSGSSVFGGTSLKKTSKVINGKMVVLYYGEGYVDGVGDNPHAYVAAEIIGPTYAYMIELNGISADPNDATIIRYLNSFRTVTSESSSNTVVPAPAADQDAGAAITFRDFAAWLPLDWEAHQSTQAGSWSVTNDEGSTVASVRCPAPEVGYEGWDPVTRVTRSYSHNGKTLYAGKLIARPQQSSEDLGWLAIVWGASPDRQAWGGSGCQINFNVASPPTVDELDRIDTIYQILK